MARNSSKRPSPVKQGRSSLAPLYAVLALAAVAGLGILLFQAFGKEAPATAPIAVELDEAQLARVQGISIGREDAPVVIYEFADFQCPACATYAWQVTPLIKERLVEPGLVRYVYYDFPLAMHPNGFLASRAGRCANEQGKFWVYHDLVYGQQSRWAAEQDATGIFVELAGQAGLNPDAFESCLRSDRYAREVTESLKLGESLGVNSTPTLFVNGRRLPNPPSFGELEEIVRRETGGAPAAAGATE